MLVKLLQLFSMNRTNNVRLIIYLFFTVEETLSITKHTKSLMLVLLDTISLFCWLQDSRKIKKMLLVTHKWNDDEIAMTIRLTQRPFFKTL